MSAATPKLCPNCGATPHVVERNAGWWHVECRSCLMQGPACTNKDRVVAPWNRLETVPEWRHDEPDPAQYPEIEMRGDPADVVIRLRAVVDKGLQPWKQLDVFGRTHDAYYVRTVVKQGWRPARSA